MSLPCTMPHAPCSPASHLSLFLAHMACSRAVHAVRAEYALFTFDPHYYPPDIMAAFVNW